MINDLPPLLRPQDQDVADRLLRNSVRDEATGCLIWALAKIRSGYGQISVGKWANPNHRSRHFRVHRVSYELFVGPIPDGMDIEHECHTQSDCNLGDNCPHRACLEPSHLVAITHHENLLRGRGVPGLNAVKTHCLNGHPLSGDNLYIIPSSGGRQCRTCRADYRAPYRAANRDRINAYKRDWQAKQAAEAVTAQ